MCILYNFLVLPDSIRNKEMSFERSKYKLQRYKNTLIEKTEKYAREDLHIPAKFRINIYILDKNLIQNKYKILIDIIDLQSEDSIELEDYLSIIRPDSLQKYIALNLDKEFSTRDNYSFVYSLNIKTKDNYYPEIGLPLQKQNGEIIEIHN